MASGIGHPVGLVPVSLPESIFTLSILIPSGLSPFVNAYIVSIDLFRVLVAAFVNHNIIMFDNLFPRLAAYPLRIVGPAALTRACYPLSLSATSTSSIYRTAIDGLLHPNHCISSLML